jgi:hypothetical protein
MEDALDERTKAARDSWAIQSDPTRERDERIMEALEITPEQVRRELLDALKREKAAEESARAAEAKRELADERLKNALENARQAEARFTEREEGLSRAMRGQQRTIEELEEDNARLEEASRQNVELFEAENKGRIKAEKERDFAITDLSEVERSGRRRSFAVSVLILSAALSACYYFASRPIYPAPLVRTTR